MTKTQAAFLLTAERFLARNPRAYFWTFTFRIALEQKECGKVFSTFMTALQWHYGGCLQGVKVAELMKNGRVHYHCLFGLRVPVDLVRKLLAGTAMGRVFVVRADAGSSEYMAKYLGKTSQSSGFEKGMRRWSCLGGFEPTRVRDLDVVSEWQKLRIMLYGQRQVPFKVNLLLMRAYKKGALYREWGQVVSRDFFLNTVIFPDEKVSTLNHGVLLMSDDYQHQHGGKANGHATGSGWTRHNRGVQTSRGGLASGGAYRIRQGIRPRVSGAYRGEGFVRCRVSRSVRGDSGGAHGQPMAALKKYRQILKVLGFHKVAISELCKVALAPEPLWKTYLAKQVTFKIALQMARAPRQAALVGDERERSLALAFITRLFGTGRKVAITALDASNQKQISVGDYSITVVKKEHKPNPISSGKKGKKK